MRQVVMRLMVAVACLVMCLAVSGCTNPLAVFSDDAQATPTLSPAVSVLGGTSWTLAQFRVNSEPLALIPTTPITLQFQRDGGYIGSSGCNFYGGTYLATSNQLHMQFASVTNKGCANRIMSQEAAYLEALQSVRTFRLDGKILTLEDDDDVTSLIFVAA
jgi:heat shock protein HslJ